MTTIVANALSEKEQEAKVFIPHSTIVTPTNMPKDILVFSLTFNQVNNEAFNGVLTPVYWYTWSCIVSKV